MGVGFMLSEQANAVDTLDQAKTSHDKVPRASRVFSLPGLQDAPHSDATDIEFGDVNDRITQSNIELSKSETA